MIKVTLSSDAAKRLRKAPKRVALKLFAWVADVEAVGLETVRRVPGYHDHPLKGELAGKRAIRLNRQWRAVYIVDTEGTIEFVVVEEVHPHAY